MRLITFFSLVIMLISVHAQAATVTYPAGIKPTSLPVSEKLTYSFRWLGIRLGRGRLNWSENDTSYKASISIKSSGIARLVNKQKRYIEVTGNKIINKDGSITYIPNRMIAKVVYPHKQRVSDQTYDKEGNIIEAIVTPPDDRRWRPDVSKKNKNASLDYFTAILAFHLHALTPSAVAKTSQLIYDGRRLTKVMEQRVGLTAKERREIGENASSVVKYNITKKLIEGYTEKEFNRDKKNHIALVSFINPKISRFPLYLYANTFMGKVTATATRE